MKRLILQVLITAFSLSTALAQKEEITVKEYSNDKTLNKKETLLKSGQKQKLFGSASFSVTEISRNTAFIYGLSGGIMLNNYLNLGVGIYKLKADLPFNNDFPHYEINGGYGGIFVGSNFAPQKIVHLNPSLFIGAGQLHNSFNDHSEQKPNSTTFFIIEPSLTIETNLTNRISLGFVTSYRSVKKLETLFVRRDTAIDNINFGLSVKYSNF